MTPKGVGVKQYLGELSEQGCGQKVSHMDGDRGSGPVALDKQVQTGDSQGQQSHLPENTDSKRSLAGGTSHP